MVLSSYFGNERQIKNHPDFLIFAHQDVFIPKEFFLNFECLYKKSKKKESIGLIGFAGITSSGKTYSLMKDSDIFLFDGNLRSQKVDSVDEFLFMIPWRIINKLSIKFCEKIPGWHAYAAELSIILRKQLLNTYVYPIYVEHNSTRVNNKGLFNTHRLVFKYYNFPLKTLVGEIKSFSFVEVVERIFLEWYSSNLKFKLKSTIIKKIKSVVLDNYSNTFSLQRKLNMYYKGKIAFIVYSEKEEECHSGFNVKLKSAKIDFRFKKYYNDECIKTLLSEYDKLVLYNFNPVKREKVKCIQKFQIITK